MWLSLRYRRYNRTTILLCASVAFLLGLALARKHIETAGWLALVGSFLVVITIPKRTMYALVIVIIAGLLLGSWRGSVFLHELAPYKTFALQKVTFTATANIDAVYGQNSQLTFVVRNVHLQTPQDVRLPGTVKVSGFGVTMVYRGDELLVSGSLYPTRGSNQATVGFAQLAKIGGTTNAIDTVRRKFAAGMQSALPEPLASFGLGLLVGQRNTLPDELTQAILMVGLTHIIAVSGYNLTILLEAAKRLMGKRSKLLSTVSALALIAGFLLIAGTSASIVRAAVISVLGIAAWYYGRTIRPLLLITLAAAGTAYANPVYLWADIGWYLSFLAFFGILVLGPLVTRLLYREREVPLLPQILVESLCAEIMTLPFVLYIFGQMSLVSLLANMLVVALIPLAMLLSLIAGIAGMCLGVISGWFAWPAQLLLTYMLDVINMLSRVPHAFQQNRYLSAIDMAACYGVIVGILGLAYVVRRRRLQFGYGISVQQIAHKG